MPYRVERADDGHRLQEVNPRFVKQYTNYTGKVFRRYEWEGKIVDIKVREGRPQMTWLMTNSEAKQEAARRLAKGEGI